jgi:hypothetical protein
MIPDDPIEMMKKLKLALDAVWNSGGWDSSPYFDESGKLSKEPLSRGPGSGHADEPEA